MKTLFMMLTILYQSWNSSSQVFWLSSISSSFLSQHFSTRQFLKICRQSSSLLMCWKSSLGKYLRIVHHSIHILYYSFSVYFFFFNGEKCAKKMNRKKTEILEKCKIRNKEGEAELRCEKRWKCTSICAITFEKPFRFFFLDVIRELKRKIWGRIFWSETQLNENPRRRGGAGTWVKGKSRRSGKKKLKKSFYSHLKIFNLLSDWSFLTVCLLLEGI